MPNAPRTTNEAAAYLKRQAESGAKWPSLCLMLQRSARGIPAMYPSAITAAVATPQSERVTKYDGLKRGMIAYNDHPSDSNPHGHIYFIIGRRPGFKLSNPDGILTWSNLAGGAVGVVPLSYYANSWGDPFQFGATWLNGYNFAEFDKEPKPDKPTLGASYEHAIEDLRKAIRFHEEKGHDRLVKVLKKDLDRMRARWQNWKPQD